MGIREEGRREVRRKGEEQRKIYNTIKTIKNEAIEIKVLLIQLEHCRMTLGSFSGHQVLHGPVCLSAGDALWCLACRSLRSWWVEGWVGIWYLLLCWEGLSRPGPLSECYEKRTLGPFGEKNKHNPRDGFDFLILIRRQNHIFLCVCSKCNSYSAESIEFNHFQVNPTQCRIFSAISCL